LILQDYSARKNPAKIQIGAQIIDATLGRVLINLLIMKPFVEKDVVLTEDFIFGFASVTADNLNEYFNSIIAKGKTVVDFDNLRKTIAETINEMSDLSGELNVLAGNSISFHDFVRLYVEDPEAEAIFNYKLEDRMQFNDIEDEFSKLGHEIEKFFLDRPETELYPFMTADTGINKKQLTQAIGFIGLKPDIDGSIIPHAIDENYLNGLKTIQNYFINAKGTRKALITNARQVRKSGYLTRKLSLALIDRYHDHSHVDCGTEHYIKYNIETQKKLDQIHGRHYYIIDKDGKKESELLTVDSNKNKDLIGKIIGLRSPVTCAAEGHVCRTCYGSELSEINEDLNTGLLSVLLLTNPLTQKLLSAKHLLTTNSEKIDWNYNDKKPFLDYFSINMNSIFIKDPDTDVLVYKVPIEDQDEDEIGEYTEKIEIIHQGKKVFTYKTPEVKLYYNMNNIKDEFDEEYDFDGEEESTKVIKLKGSDFDDNEAVFTFMAKNNELTKSLQQILDLIESSGHLDVKNYDELVNNFDDLILENGLDIMSVHAEMISSVLIVDKETGNKLDFSKKRLNNYEILRVSNTVLNGPIAKALAFERLPEQFINLKTYEKDEESLMDYLYY
jgi:cell fate (sporulation/competence/biofilm development) regulator YlbF (YheA/YmcA/DUF963 family)